MGSAVKIGGEPWFAAVDILRTLGLRVGGGASVWVALLADDEKRRENKASLKTSEGWVQGLHAVTHLVSESGLYKIVLRAQASNPLAREFQDWVTRDVLPAIRKDGGYVMGEEKIATGDMTEAEFIAKAMGMLQRKAEGGSLPKLR